MFSVFFIFFATILVGIVNLCMQLEGLHEANGTANMGQFVNGFGGATEEFQCYGF